MASGGAVFAGAPEGGTLAAVSTVTPAAGTIDSKEWLTWTSGFASGFLADVFITRLPVVTTGFSVAEGATAADATGATAGAVWSTAGSTGGAAVVPRLGQPGIELQRPAAVGGRRREVAQGVAGGAAVVVRLGVGRVELEGLRVQVEAG